MITDIDAFKKANQASECLVSCVIEKNGLNFSKPDCGPISGDGITDIGRR